MKCICEKCGKKFDTPEEAMRCENYHIEAEKEAEAKKAEKQAACDAINKSIDEFMETYGELPRIKVSGRLTSILPMRDIFDILLYYFGVFFYKSYI